MYKAARKEEQRSAGRWFLAAALLLGVPLVLSGPFLLFGSWIYDLAGPDIAMIVYYAGILSSAGAMLAGAVCLIAAAVIHISAETRPH